MIRKPRKPSLELLTLRALAPRFPQQYPTYKYFEKDLGRAESGYKGEQSIDYYLNVAARSNHNLIYHHLRLLTPESAFQIDTLTLTPKFILIIEIKYLGGVMLEFNHETNQLKQTFQDHSVEMHDCPLLQVKRQANHLKDWLNKKGYDQIPVEHLVVMTHRSPELKFSNGFPECNRIIRSSFLDFSISEIERKYSHTVLKSHELSNLDFTLLSSHKEKSPNVLQKYNLHLDQVKKGLLCPKCLTLPMLREKKSWYCKRCSRRTNEREELLKALQEFSLLVSPTIKNSEFRDFFGVYPMPDM
ncbi:nuclease-related domain-containing protein [Alteribacter aurantiacus]|uniref:nuclease-related domain-containing protein n=1 Tax=Alteribacter aurantiacus TaxID=254410 RepID=UPI00041FEDD0|nr:nuclease-related domain-containing protein [Alteribacter aurantiacus]